VRTKQILLEERVTIFS